MASTKKPTTAKTKNTAPKTTNGMAIAGFVCSFFFQILGLIFSIIGLCQVKTSGEKGRGLAIAGIVISSVITFFSVLVTIMALTFGFWAVDRAVEYLPEKGCSYEFTYSEAKDSHNIKYDCEAK